MIARIECGSDVNRKHPRHYEFVYPAGINLRNSARTFLRAFACMEPPQDSSQLRRFRLMAPQAEWRGSAARGGLEADDAALICHGNESGYWTSAKNPALTFC
jgi:hypothetical protein